MPKKYIHNLEDPVEKKKRRKIFKKLLISKSNCYGQIIIRILGIHYTNNRGLPIILTLQLLTIMQFYSTGYFQIRLHK